MKNTSKLPKTVSKRAKRVGRGYGSGKGAHTSGRGQKGQKARGSVHILFEGLKTKKSLLHRLPHLRGKSRNKGFAAAVVLNVGDLERLPAGAKVDLETLVKHGLVNERKARKYGVKILGMGESKKNFELLVPASSTAAKKIEKKTVKVKA